MCEDLGRPVCGIDLWHVLAGCPLLSPLPLRDAYQWCRPKRKLLVQFCNHEAAAACHAVRVPLFGCEDDWCPAWIIVAGSLVLSWRACLRCERHHSHVVADCCAFVRPTELEAALYASFAALWREEAPRCCQLGASSRQDVPAALVADVLKYTNCGFVVAFAAVNRLGAVDKSGGSDRRNVAALATHGRRPRPELIWQPINASSVLRVSSTLQRGVGDSAPTNQDSSSSADSW